MDDPRPGANPPPDYAVWWLRCILDRRDRALERVRASEDDLARAAYLVHEREGASVRQLGRALGVSKSTAANWVKHGEKLAARG